MVNLYENELGKLRRDIVEYERAMRCLEGFHGSIPAELEFPLRKIHEEDEKARKRFVLLETLGVQNVS